MISIQNSYYYDIPSTFQIILVNLFYKYDIVGNNTMSNYLFKMNLQDNACYNATCVHARIEECVMNKSFFVLCHQNLGHIFQPRMKRLVNDGVLNTPDFIDFDTCITCTSIERTNKSNKYANRSCWQIMDHTYRYLYNLHKGRAD